jgi:Flp pilus assembly protein protease CpaA
MLLYFLILGLISAIAIRAAVIDHRHGILPNRLTGLIFGFALIWVLLDPGEFNLLEYLLVVALHFGAVFLPKGGLGAGDAKYIAGLGLITATWGVSWSWLLLSYSSAAIWALIGQKTSNIRFGPWLSAAWLVVGMGQFAHVALAYSR